jgi:hypothetical protein
MALPYLPFSRSIYAKSKALIVRSSYNYLAASRRVEPNKLFFVHENGGDHVDKTEREY